MGNSLTRAFILCFCMWHVGAVGAKLMPNFPVWGTWQSPARRVFGPWLRNTKTTQSWRMFAPNPPRSNSFMKTVVIDGDGKHWDPCATTRSTATPTPSSSTTACARCSVGWSARASGTCATGARTTVALWELEHGKPAKEVQIYKVTTRIPPPKKTKNKPWNPRKRKRTNDLRAASHLRRSRASPPWTKSAAATSPLTRTDLERERKAAEKAQKDHDKRTKSWERRRDFGGEKGRTIPSPAWTGIGIAPSDQDPVRHAPGGSGGRAAAHASASLARVAKSPRAGVGRPERSVPGPSPNESTAVTATPRHGSRRQMS